MRIANQFKMAGNSPKRMIAAAGLLAGKALTLIVLALAYFAADAEARRRCRNVAARPAAPCVPTAYAAASSASAD